MTAATRRTGAAPSVAATPSRPKEHPRLTLADHSASRSAHERAKASRRAAIRIGVASVFLIATMIGSLTLRTWMQEDSFENTSVQQSIGRLQQDIQDDQGKLDQLEASLPDKAQEMGMVASTGSVTIDLDGYREGQ